MEAKLTPTVKRLLTTMYRRYVEGDAYGHQVRFNGRSYRPARLHPQSWISIGAATVKKAHEMGLIEHARRGLSGAYVFTGLGFRTAEMLNGGTFQEARRRHLQWEAEQSAKREAEIEEGRRQEEALIESMRRIILPMGEREFPGIEMGISVFNDTVRSDDRLTAKMQIKAVRVEFQFVTLYSSNTSFWKSDTKEFCEVTSSGTRLDMVEQIEMIHELTAMLAIRQRLNAYYAGAMAAVNQK